MYYLGNRVVEPLGPGSKEKKAAFLALGQFVGLDLSSVPGKCECGRLIAERVGEDWDDTCISSGDTVTLTGLNRVVDGAVRWHLNEGRRPARSLVRDLQNLHPAPRWDDNPEQDMAEDLTELNQNLIDAIASLMADGATPLSVDSSRFFDVDRDAISISTGTWRSPVAAIQGWMHLPREIDGSSPEVFDRSLGEMLGLAPAEVGHPATFFSRLQERLERAGELRERFLEELDDEAEGTVTLETASGNWDSWWSDVEEGEDVETAGPIQAGAHVWTIAQFRQYAIDREIDLNPSYQRADVWPTADAQLLVESVLRGIPLPSVIVLKWNTDEGDRYEIVDGKQRLTSLLRFTASHPKALSLVADKAGEWGVDVDELQQIFMTNYPSFKKQWRKNEPTNLTAKREKELYFPFPLRSGEVRSLSGELEQARGRYYSEIRNIVIQIGSGKKKIRTLFEDVSNYRIPVIEYEEATSRQIHEVFSLYNKQGKHLNAEEIRNATYHHLDFMRAILATSGDADGIEQVAPFLSSSWHDLSSTGHALVDPSGPYGYTEAGYKRTKALSWVAATLLLEDDRLSSRSTARHITALLDRIHAAPADPLRDTQRVIEAMVMLDKAVDAHQVVPPETWAPRFRNARGSGRWQELQLVASLIALAVAHVAHGDSLQDRLEDAVEDISEASQGWTRPPKTQSRQQWEFVAGVVREFLTTLNIDSASVDNSIRKQFGYSGLCHLLDLPRPTWWN
ncbi:DUF262 domain-containing protein [Ruania alba]|nr:DUF262 domain-containing protein [Ruania alba]